MIKYWCYIFILLLILSCKSESPSEQIADLAEFKCLKSQSACIVDTKVGKFAVQFAIKEKVYTEVEFKIALSLVAPDLSELAIREQRKVEQDKIEVIKSLTEITQIKAYLEGRDMYMGKIPVFFEPQVLGDDYQAVAMLGSCSEAEMIWRLWFSIEFYSGEEKETQSFFIDFESTRY